MARDHFAKGVAFFADEAWDAALVEFLKSRALFPTRNATKNAALCLRQLHRFDEALDMFEALLREFPDLPGDARALAEKEMKNLQTLVGKIELHGGEPGATIVIDSRTRGTTPSIPIRVSVGTHVVRVIKDGYLPFEAQVQVASGQITAVDVKMRQLEQAGKLRVTETAGKVVNVLVDNVVVGKTPWEGSLPVGDHAVALDGEGNIGTVPTRAPITLGQVTPIALTAQELDARLRIQPTPNVATVAIDGVIVGRGMWEGKLHAGPHRIEMSAETYLPLVREVTIPKGERTVLSFALEPDPKASLTFKEAEAARQAWLDKSGSTFTFEVRAQGIVMITPRADIPAGNVTSGTLSDGTPFTDDFRRPVEDFGGGGVGGLGVRVAYLFLALRDPALGSTWHGFRVGTGIDANLGYWYTLGSFPTKSTQSGTQTTTTYDSGVWGAGWMFNIPFTLGYQIGLGKYRGREWSGVALGIAYTPTYDFLKPSAPATSSSSWRLAAFEVSIDFLDKPIRAQGKTAIGKFFVYVLPPAKGEPFIINFGGGAAWY